MATINNLEIFKGEAPTLNFTMSPVVDITGWTITMTIRVNANDAAVVLTKTPATIILAAAGTFKFTLSSAETKALSVGNYAYDIQRVDAGSESVLSIGDLAIIQEVLYP